MKWSDVFTYKNGHLYWKIQPSKRTKKGSYAGYKNNKGYLVVAYKYNHYKVHRIVWELFNEPIRNKRHQIDHIDQNKSNNKIENLRLVTQSQNQHNTGLRKDNKSGVRGVKYQHPYWIAQIQINGKRKHLCCSKSKQKAVQVRQKTEKELLRKL